MYTDYQDARDWLQIVDKMGELKKFDGVDWDQELGMIMFLASTKDTDAPAVLFDNIKGSPKGYRVLVNRTNSRKRLAMTCRIETPKTDMELVDLLRHKLKDIKKTPTKTVKDGPILQNIQKGNDIDLFKFPTPRFSPEDGGRYIGTGVAEVTKDPETGWINVGAYRTMISTKDSVLTMIDFGQHGDLHRTKYFAQGKPMPAVIICGGDPLLHVVASWPLPYGANEYEYMGGIMGRPVEVIEGPATGLPIPTNAEIAIEVEYLPDESRIEGPFAEWTFSYGSGARPEPVGRVLSVLHRDDPILFGKFGAGKSRRGVGGDRIVYNALAKSASIWNEMEAAGVPDVKGVWCHPVGMHNWIVVSIKQRYLGHSKQAGLVAASCGSGNWYGRYIIVVDDDIDPSFDWDVIYALQMRSDPERSIQVLKGVRSGKLDTAFIPEERGLSNKAIIDATIPFEWSPENRALAQQVKSDKVTRQRVIDRWGDALLK
ncbi:UbiD family decarboxylase [Chloroflexota bacterium]